MPHFLNLENPILSSLLQNGCVGILPTDTLYGIVGSATQEKVVERIYRLKHRQPSKPFIVLIGSLEQTRLLGVRCSKNHLLALKKFWPGPTSILLPCTETSFAYLHRGSEELAFRLPNHTHLQSLIQRTGPLVAPSANVEGEPTVKTMQEAHRLFKDQVDFYVDGGERNGSASKLIRIGPDGTIKILRP